MDHSNKGESNDKGVTNHTHLSLVNAVIGDDLEIIPSDKPIREFDKLWENMHTLEDLDGREETLHKDDVIGYIPQDHCALNHTNMVNFQSIVEQSEKDVYINEDTIKEGKILPQVNYIIWIVKKVYIMFLCHPLILKKMPTTMRKLLT
ncbi:hypothetical protein IEQ34_005075 [Dendrobium chrysotoxum]|uniref:Uncharacterized protein n=1 Tax=Dendrobium chrysotoxum TaxID=161865 RepID=A0AAV7HAT1_DENCH|nr:hypothetical protein IEQ34_005075 [Dendrobium chrysotoxum]